MSFRELFNGIQEAYEQFLSGKEDVPESSAFTPYPRDQDSGAKSPLKKLHVKKLSIAGVVLVILSAWLVQPHKKQPVSRTVVAEKAVQTCPTGAPKVTVTGVQLVPDPDLDPPSALYMVTGTITNLTTGIVSVDGIGFYFGQLNPLRPPDWSDSMGNMDVSADPTHILPGEAIQWRDKQVEILDQPAGTDVSAALSYPENINSNTSFQWSWPDADLNCPSPTIFN